MVMKLWYHTKHTSESNDDIIFNKRKEVLAGQVISVKLF